MSGTTALTISYVLATAGLTGVLIWGLKKISAVMQLQAGGGATVMREVLSETTEPKEGEGQQPQGKGSFSRIAGAIGAVAIAATFVGIGYWAIYALFYEPTHLTHFKDLGTYFLAGSALFFPYAFNQLSKIFKSI